MTRVWKVHCSSLRQRKKKLPHTLFYLIFCLVHRCVGIFLCLDFFIISYFSFPTHSNRFFSETKNWNGMENSSQDEDFQKTPLFCFFAYRKPAFIGLSHFFDVILTTSRSQMTQTPSKETFLVTLVQWLYVPVEYSEENQLRSPLHHVIAEPIMCCFHFPSVFRLASMLFTLWVIPPPLSLAST